jgi:hypothetical protein
VKKGTIRCPSDWYPRRIWPLAPRGRRSAKDQRRHRSGAEPDGRLIAITVILRSASDRLQDNVTHDRRCVAAECIGAILQHPCLCIYSAVRVLCTAFPRPLPVSIASLETSTKMKPHFIVALVLELHSGGISGHCCRHLPGQSSPYPEEGPTKAFCPCHTSSRDSEPSVQLLLFLDHQLELMKTVFARTHNPTYAHDGAKRLNEVREAVSLRLRKRVTCYRMKEDRPSRNCSSHWRNRP